MAPEARLTIADQVCLSHISHPVRTELHAAHICVAAEFVFGCGAIEYAFADGSKVIFLGVTCFQLEWEA